jgi:uncharacterized membrane protein HdeD (DUF308 family)
MTKSFTLPLTIMGLVLFLFGFIAVTAPNMTVDTLMLYLAYMLLAVGGVAAAVGFIIRKSSKTWYVSLIMGMLLFSLGLLVFLKNSEAAHYYNLFIAGWAALMGGSLVAASFFQKQLRIVLIVNGMMSLGFGLVIYFNPFTGTNTLNFMVGFYTILLSVMLLYLAFRAFRSGKSEPKTSEVS